MVSDNIRFAPILDEAINPIERLRGRRGVARTARTAETPLAALASRAPRARLEAASSAAAVDLGPDATLFEEPTLIRARSGGVHRAARTRRVSRRTSAAAFVLAVACLATVITIFAF